MPQPSARLGHSSGMVWSRTIRLTLKITRLRSETLVCDHLSSPLAGPQGVYTVHVYMYSGHISSLSLQ